MENEKTDAQLAIGTARRAMKIVICIGMIAVLLLMINIYIMLTQITATAQMSKEIKAIEKAIDSSPSVSQE